MPWFPCCCDDECLIARTTDVADFTQIRGTWTSPLSTVDSDALAVLTQAHPQSSSAAIVNVEIDNNAGAVVRIIVAYDSTAGSYLYAQITFADPISTVSFWQFDGVSHTQLGNTESLPLPAVDQNMVAQLCYEPGAYGAPGVLTFTQALGCWQRFVDQVGDQVGVGTAPTSADTLTVRRFEYQIHKYDNPDCEDCVCETVCDICLDDEAPDNFAVVLPNFSGASDCCNSNAKTVIVNRTAAAGCQWTLVFSRDCGGVTGLIETVTLTIFEQAPDVIIQVIHAFDSLLGDSFTYQVVLPQEPDCLGVNGLLLPLVSSLGSTCDPTGTVVNVTAV